MEGATLPPIARMSVVLPPIGNGDSDHSLSHSSTKPSNTITKPPSYLEASQENSTLDSTGMLSQKDYWGGQGTVAAGIGTGVTGGLWNICSRMGMVVDTSQYISESRIHLSAMEGINASGMKALASQHGVDYRDRGCRTPLMYAILGNKPKICEILIKLKANVNIQDGVEFTPLLWATFHARPDIMKILLK